MKQRLKNTNIDLSFITQRQHFRKRNNKERRCRDSNIHMTLNAKKKQMETKIDLCDRTKSMKIREIIYRKKRSNVLQQSEHNSTLKWFKVKVWFCFMLKTFNSCVVVKYLSPAFD